MLHSLGARVAAVELEDDRHAQRLHLRSQRRRVDPRTRGQPGCPFDDVTMAYCPLDGNVYIGEAITWALYNGFDPSTGETGEPNDSTIVFALAHEIGHRLQHVAGMPMSDPEKPSEQIAQENQADCVGGTFIDYLIRRDVMILGDYTRDLADGIISMASTEGPERDHGTIDQRMSPPSTRATCTAIGAGCSRATTSSPTSTWRPTKRRSTHSPTRVSPFRRRQQRREVGHRRHSRSGLGALRLATAQANKGLRQKPLS